MTSRENDLLSLVRHMSGAAFGSGLRREKSVRNVSVTGKIFLRWRHFMHDCLFDSSVANHNLCCITKYISVT